MWLTICLSICFSLQDPGQWRTLSFCDLCESVGCAFVWVQCDYLIEDSMSFLTKRVKKKKLLKSHSLEMTSKTKCLMERYGHNSVWQRKIEKKNYKSSIKPNQP